MGAQLRPTNLAADEDENRLAIDGRRQVYNTILAAKHTGVFFSLGSTLGFGVLNNLACQACESVTRMMPFNKMWE